jgi:type I restriction enzyme, S subunit
MDAEQLLEHFDRVAEAPGSIAALRRFILDLAVRGKLTEQNSDVEKVHDEFLTAPTSEELPINWHLLNFGEFCDIQGGSQPPKSKFVDDPAPGYIRLFQIRDLGENPVPVYVPKNTTNRFCKEGEILIGRYGASVGKIFWAQHGTYNVALAKFIYPDKAFLSQFAFLILKSNFFQATLAGVTRSAQAGFNKSDLSQIDFPLPPLIEQSRIIAKVDELMDLCDRLEAAQKNRENLRDRLVAASLHQLNQAADSNEEFFDRARFYFDNLAKLSVRSEHIKQLRQNILNLAVSGKLTPQNPNDEPALKLLDKIKLEKEELIAKKIIRKEKPLSALKNKDFPFAIPSSWEWVKIGVASLFTEYGTSQQSANSELGVPVLKMGDIQEGKVIIGNHKKVPETIDDLPALYLKKFDLLYNRYISW